MLSLFGWIIGGVLVCGMLFILMLLIEGIWVNHCNLEVKRAILAQPKAEPETTPAPTYDEELKRYREKIKSLKALISQKNEELRSLKSKEPKEGNSGKKEVERENPYDDSVEEDTRCPKGFLLPTLTKTAIDSIRHEVPIKQAKQALSLLGGLCAGDDATWAKAKRLNRQVMGLYSIRLGIHHRMYFEYDTHEGTLTVIHVLPRSAQDTVLKKWARVQ